MSEAPDDFLTTLFITFKECEMVRMIFLSRPNHKIEEQLCQNLEATIDPVEHSPYSEDPDTKSADAADNAFHTLTTQILIEETRVRSDIDIYVKDRVNRTPKLKAWISQVDIDILCTRAEGMFLW
jgi:hypothetical protein